jgi:hypothetical protein
MAIRLGTQKVTVHVGQGRDEKWGVKNGVSETTH